VVFSSALGSPPLRSHGPVATVAVQAAVRGRADPVFVANLFIVLLTLVGIAQVLDLPILQTDQQVVLHRVGFFLPL
jgi:hypothetical protein